MRLILLGLALLLSGCDVLVPPVVPPVVDPTPQPVGNVAWVIVVEETQARTPEIAAVLADEWWHSNGIKFRVYDKDSPDAAGAVKAVGTIPLPALLLLNKDSKVLKVTRLPSSIDGVKALVK
jgi:hypothetical protein